MTLGWRTQGPVILEDQNGMTMDLTTGSPALMAKIMVQAYNRKIEDRVEQVLAKRGQAFEKGNQRSVVRSLRRSKTVARDKKTCLCNW